MTSKENKMGTKKVYEKLDVLTDGKYYKEWEVPENMPLGYEFTTIAPPVEMITPKWDNMKNQWEESSDSLVVHLQHQLAELQDIVLSMFESEEE